MYTDSAKPLSQAQLDQFCKVWADDGYDDPSDQFFVLFGGDAPDHPEYAAIEAICQDCGLQSELRDGELWVLKSQQIHDEIGAHWA